MTIITPKLQLAANAGAPIASVEFDATRGYVTSAYIDIDERMADEELSFQAQGLTPLR